LGSELRRQQDESTLLSLEPHSDSASRESLAVPSSQGTGAALAHPSALHLSSWLRQDWLLHGFSTRLGGVSQLPCSRGEGDLNLGYTPDDDPAAVEENRQRFLAAVLPRNSILPDAAHSGIVTLKQMHSGVARRVARSEIGERAALWGDGLMTDEPGVLLGIQTADCLPVLVADVRRRAVAAFHAGWRGTLKGIVERGVTSMSKEFGSRPEDLTAAIGPGIGCCCFTVGREVADLFAARYPYAQDLFQERGGEGGGLRLDLAEANRRQLLSAGLSAEAIHSLGLCTSCHTDRFFSYRAERGRTGRMMAVIGVRPV
jgi:YfiH family protein